VCCKTEPAAKSGDTLLHEHPVIFNDPPYGSERSYNGLRLAVALAKHDPAGNITLFLMPDAVFCAKKGQKTLESY
jgi:uncharacterized protein involved in oxidation of intracellular sulfur